MPEFKQNKLPFYKIAIAAGTGSCIGEIVTLPLDTIKVRMQLFQGKYNSTLHCAKTIYAEEGLATFWNGLTAGLLRQAVYGTLRIAMFDVGINYLASSKGEDKITLLDRGALGILTGGLAMTIANPTDVVKVRFQAAMKSAGSGPPKYTNVFQAFPKIYAEEGLMGFYQS